MSIYSTIVIYKIKFSLRDNVVREQVRPLLSKLKNQSLNIRGTRKNPTLQNTMVTAGSVVTNETTTELSNNVLKMIVHR